MKKNILLLSLLLAFLSSYTIAQNKDYVPSKEEALKEIYWLRDNPLSPMDSIFINKYSAALNWYAYNTTNHKFAIVGLKEFMTKYKSDAEYRYQSDILLLYTASQIAFLIEENTEALKNPNYFSVIFILEYYDNLKIKDEKLKNDLFEKYKILEKKGELKKYIKNL